MHNAQLNIINIVTRTNSNSFLISGRELLSIAASCIQFLYIYIYIYHIRTGIEAR